MILENAKWQLYKQFRPYFAWVTFIISMNYDWVVVMNVFMCDLLIVIQTIGVYVSILEGKCKSLHLYDSIFKYTKPVAEDLVTLLYTISSEHNFDKSLSILFFKLQLFRLQKSWVFFYIISIYKLSFTFTERAIFVLANTKTDWFYKQLSLFVSGVCAP